MTSISAQIIDQRVRRVATETGSALIAEAGIKNDENALMSASFVFLVTKTLLALTSDEVIDCLVDGGNDFGIDEIYFGPVQDNEFSITLVQGKYKRNLNGDANFPENDVKKHGSRDRRSV